MLKTTRLHSLFVLDQDEALEFYVGKLGLEVHTDQDLGFMRWLTINVPGDPGREILLEKPSPPPSCAASPSPPPAPPGPRPCSRTPPRRRWTTAPPRPPASWSARAPRR